MTILAHHLIRRALAMGTVFGALSLGAIPRPCLAEGEAGLDPAAEQALLLQRRAAEPPPTRELNALPAAKDAPSLDAMVRSFSPVAGAPRSVTGTLSGRVVYCSGGHGWTWNNSSAWITQRGDNLSGAADVVEDMGNVDQLYFFAEYCLNAGATVVPFRPIGFQDNEVVIDNDDAQVTFTGSWSNSVNPRFFGSPGDTPYRFATSVVGSTTATAVYNASSLLPAAGYYPVYVWVNTGTDRINQQMIITHSGGQTTRRVNFRKVGQFWIYLGTYYFSPGGPASVTITNNEESGDTGSVVIADAVRFGNGMGSIDRGGGVSGHPRQEEASKYWVMAGYGQGGSAGTLYYGSGSDDISDNVGTPPRMAALMNQAGEGTRESRVFVGFHSNAGAGRGADGLICSNPVADSPFNTDIPNANTTVNGLALAVALGRRVNEDLYALTNTPANGYEVVWSTRGIPGGTDGSHIFGSGGAGVYSYGEISVGATDDEFDATIIEVAFHDNSNDCLLLRDPRVRSDIARASLKGIIQHFNTFDGATLAYPPEPPTDSAVVSDASGNLTLKWAVPVSGGAYGDAPTGYVVYVSSDGFGYGDPQIVSGGATTSLNVTALVPSGQARFFRVAATNSGGESFPSISVGARRTTTGHKARVLVVNGFDRLFRSQNPRQTENLTSPSDTQTFDRIDLARSNSFNYVPVLGLSVANAGIEFDSCQNDSIIDGSVLLTDYKHVFWILGEESTADETFSATEQEKVETFIEGMGDLFVSGAEIGYDLDGLGSTADRAFFNNYFGTDYSGDSAATYAVQGQTGSIFAGLSFSFDDGTQGNYNTGTADRLATFGGNSSIGMTYVGGSGGNAGIVYDGTSVSRGKVVCLGFPLETITSAAARNSVVSSALTYFLGTAAEITDWTLLDN